MSKSNQEEQVRAPGGPEWRKLKEEVFRDNPEIMWAYIEQAETAAYRQGREEEVRMTTSEVRKIFIDDMEGEFEALMKYQLPMKVAKHITTRLKELKGVSNE